VADDDAVVADAAEVADATGVAGATVAADATDIAGEELPHNSRTADETGWVRSPN
jgi:hypothetical protein